MQGEYPKQHPGRTPSAVRQLQHQQQTAEIADTRPWVGLRPWRHQRSSSSRHQRPELRVLEPAAAPYTIRRCDQRSFDYAVHAHTAGHQYKCWPVTGDRLPKCAAMCVTCNMLKPVRCGAASADTVSSQMLPGAHVISLVSFVAGPAYHGKQKADSSRCACSAASQYDVPWPENHSSSGAPQARDPGSHA